MKSKEYWEGRFIDLQRSQLKRADSFAHELEDLHARMKKEIDDDITVWHKKVATANGISMADAKKLMSRKDRKEFQWTLEEYEQHAKADLLSGVTSANVMNASANWHLSYLDGMKLQLEHHVDKLYKNIDSKTRNHFKESLNENYLNTAFELQKGIGIGEKMEVPYDERKLENILRTPWASDGKNFSQRIWKDRTQLVNNLQKNLSESVIRGDSDTDMIQALSKDEKKAEFNTRRLVETESAFFDSESERQCCEDFGIEKYRFLAVLDMKTSDICQELDNKVFLEKDRQVGVNAPPMHPFCRSTTAPVIDEEFLTSRRAKNPKTGEYDEIPPEMNYKQWKEKYVEGKDNAEEVKQEQVKVPKETERGYKLEVPAENVKASEGETVHKETILPPKQQEEKEFNSEVYNNHVEEKANKQTVNSSEEEARINAEVEKRVAEEREKIKKEFAKKQEEIQEQINQQTTPVNQNVQPVDTRTKEEILKDDTKEYIYNNFPHIPKGNIHFEDFDENITQTLNIAFVHLNEDIKPYMEKITGKKIEFTTINYLSSGKDYYNIVTDKKNWPQIEQNLISYYKNKTGGQTPTLSFLQSFKRDLERKTNFNGNSRTLAFALSPDSPTVLKNNYGIYINPDVVKKYSKINNNFLWHPKGFNGFISDIYHEIGHTIDYKFDLASNKNIQKLYIKDLARYKSVMDYWRYEWKGQWRYSCTFKDALEKAKQDADKKCFTEYGKTFKQIYGYDFAFLSQYSFEDNKKYNTTDPDRYREFIAETISEIFTVGEQNASPIAREVWREIIIQIKNNSKIPNKF